MSSRLTELGPRIHAFATVDAALDALAEAHGDPNLIAFPTVTERPSSAAALGAGRVLPLRPSPAIAPDAAENFTGPEAA